MAKRAAQIDKVWEFVRKHQTEIADRMKAHYDRNRRPLILAPGDQVLVSTASHPLLLGPFGSKVSEKSVLM